ncbi:MAG: thiol:disulfide interchange protein DsbD [Flavobacterium sp.]|jgi:thiol:disulfide interchange protein DsbD
MTKLIPKILLKLSVLLMLLLSQFASAEKHVEANPETIPEFQTATAFLPVDEAFRLTASSDDGLVKLYWQISPGYYLYRHKIRVGDEAGPAEIVMLPGIKKTDEYFGNVEVYYEQLEVETPVLTELNKGLQVEFQGCADAGICYPPRKITIYP